MKKISRRNRSLASDCESEMQRVVLYDIDKGYNETFVGLQILQYIHEKQISETLFLGIELVERIGAITTLS